MYKTFAALAGVSVVLCGCATSAPPYVIPPNIPYANLKSSIWGANGSMESIAITLFDKSDAVRGDKKLFAIARSKSRPAGYVKVPANELLTLSYAEAASGGRYCQLDIQVRFEEGKNYELIGGFDYEKGPIPIFTGVRKCKFGVKEAADGLGAAPG